MNWKPIKELPHDFRPPSGSKNSGKKVIGILGDEVRTTWLAAYYARFPHEDGGPTYKYRWTYHALDGLFLWRPTHFAILTAPTGEE
jgi:hypothetical protein